MSRTNLTLKLSAVVTVASLLMSANAHAQEAPTGPQLALTIERFAGLGFTYGRVDAARGGVDFAGFVLGGPQANPLGAPRVGFDFISAGNFVLGGTLGFSMQSLTIRAESSSTEAPSGSLWTLLMGLRAGYRLRLGRVVDIIPRGGLTFLTGTMGLPGGRSCNYTFDPMTGRSGPPVCTDIAGPSGSVFGGMLSLDAIARIRITQGFFLDAGLAYDHVLFANFSTDEPRSSGATRTTEAPTSGTYFNFQAWVGLGGYL